MDIAEVPNWFLFLISNLVIAGAVYGGIRSDLKHMTERIAHLEKVSEGNRDRIGTTAADTAVLRAEINRLSGVSQHAHRRIDDILAERNQSPSRQASITAVPLHHDSEHRHRSPT